MVLEKEFPLNPLDGQSIQFIKEATRGVVLKKVFLKISQISPENICVEVSF